MKRRIYSFLALAILLFFIQTAKGQIAPNGRQTISIRQGSSVVLRANSAGAASYIWYKDDVLIEGQRKSTLITATAGIYKVASINKFGCTSDISDEIGVIILPQLIADVAITKRSESKIVVGDQVFEYYLNVRNNGADNATQLMIKDALPDNLSLENLNQPTDGVAIYDALSRTINWNIPLLANGKFAELVIKVKSKQAGMVSNTATVIASEFDPNLANNTSTDKKEISGLRIPNVFTPNGDGKNDTFFIEHLESFESNEVTIINRWGSTVYQSNHYVNDWTAPGLADGTYFYVIKVRNGTATWQDYKGYVTVVR
ncbi:gliding motility-associated C-terminal domain-containing protein [Pedobacter sp. PF22-3]|uniref:T9SS type B sorting domain-containing protein n=1 Tax=Pedobacter sp. PF22-3 TaxID=2994467 RepID=UPI002245AF39|nr:gliding motility-associated C-terminal domain-containing protein [Pedobacter sp. PF22-3]MCX2494521.1 gliding motility-associated C-terminal domain-containing protein [Pedobacter sp. PF22-3]